jgi:GT2 family glycosyltransferase
MTAPLKICAVLAAFNRRERTMCALRSFFSQGGDVDLSAVLMDDGSTDGTTEAVQAEFRQVIALKGDGSLYWNRGMAEAFKAACAFGADYYLWLNDDTVLYPDALNSLIQDAQVIQNPQGCILVGSTKDSMSASCTYGGVRSISKWHAGKFSLIEPGTEVQSCDTLNGNVVLISAAAAEVVGDIDTYFSHSMGDYDYGLRAVGAGVSVLIGRNYHGECPRNPVGSAWYESGKIRDRYKRACSPKGLPMKEWAYFLKAHGNAFWFLGWVSSYRRIITG